MTHSHLSIPYSDFPTPGDCVSIVNVAGSGKKWRWLGVSAVADRVLWEVGDDGVTLHFREIPVAAR